MSYVVQKVFSSVRSNLLFVLMPVLKAFCSQNLLLCQEFKSVSYFIFYHIQGIRSYFEAFELFGAEFYIQWQRNIEFHSSRYTIYSIWPPQYNANSVFSSMCAISIFFKNQLAVRKCVYICVFNYILLINESLFMAIPFCFKYCSSVASLEIWDNNTSLFFVQDCFSYRWSFVFPCEN